MKAKLFLTTFVLVAAPAMAIAEGCGFGHYKEQITMSCPQGQTFDQDSKSCIKPTG